MPLDVNVSERDTQTKYGIVIVLLPFPLPFPLPTDNTPKSTHLAKVIFNYNSISQYLPVEGFSSRTKETICRLLRGMYSSNKL